MLLARKATDPRSEFDVYMDLARRLVKRDLSEELKDFPGSDADKEQLMEMEAYKLAQPAHLTDVSTYEPANLLGMLERYYTFGSQPAAPTEG